MAARSLVDYQKPPRDLDKAQHPPLVDTGSVAARVAYFKLQRLLILLEMPAIPAAALRRWGEEFRQMRDVLCGHANSTTVIDAAHSLRKRVQMFGFVALCGVDNDDQNEELIVYTTRMRRTLAEVAEHHSIPYDLLIEDDSASWTRLEVSAERMDKENGVELTCDRERSLILTGAASRRKAKQAIEFIRDASHEMMTNIPDLPERFGDLDPIRLMFNYSRKVDIADALLKRPLRSQTVVFDEVFGSFQATTPVENNAADALVAADQVQQESAEQSAKPRKKDEAEALPETDHSPDFRSVFWFGSEFEFTTNQAECVRVMWQAFEKRTRSMSGITIIEQAGVSRNDGRLDQVFRCSKAKGYHPAWGTMIQDRGKGAYSLVAPETSSNPLNRS